MKSKANAFGAWALKNLFLSHSLPLIYGEARTRWKKRERKMCGYSLVYGGGHNTILGQAGNKEKALVWEIRFGCFLQ